MKKKILTIEDLVRFCKEKDLKTFSSEESGYSLSVKVPSTFSVEEDDLSRKGLMKLKIRVLHCDLNRNGSFVSKESAERAKASIAGRPILAAIHQLDDGTYDFQSHEIELVQDEDGNDVLEYIEKQVGSFTYEEPWFEHDDENDKEYLCAYAVIPTEYTKASEIIQSKNGTYVSSELAIEKMTYDAGKGYLVLDDWYVSGLTLLGKEDDGTEFKPGMEGARADIVDFSQQNNSFRSEIDEKLIETLEKLNNTISNFNIQNSKEGGNTPMKFEELLEKYGKTAEDITFEYDGLSDEELEAKFAEVFGEVETEDPSSEENNHEEDFEENSEGTSEGESTDSSNDPENFEENHDPVVMTGYSVKMSDGSVREFALSSNQENLVLEVLVNTVYEEDPCWYSIDVYTENKELVMHDWTGLTAYRQSYEIGDDNKYSLVGERVAVHYQWLSDEEQRVLDLMKANYDALNEEVSKYRAAEEETNKVNLLNSEDYSSISDTEEFTAIQNDRQKYSLDEMKSELDGILLKYARSGKLNFAHKDEKKNVPLKGLVFGNKKMKKSRYGGLFS